MSQTNQRRILAGSVLVIFLGGLVFGGVLGQATPSHDPCLPEAVAYSLPPTGVRTLVQEVRDARLQIEQTTREMRAHFPEGTRSP